MIERIDDVLSTKKERTKERNSKEHMAYEHMDIRTNEGSTDDSNVNSTNDTNSRSRQGTTPRYVKQRKDVEIDAYLFDLIRDGLIDERYRSWHAKCIYTIGIERYNVLVLDVRSMIEAGRRGEGIEIYQPARLMSYKLKGTMQLHYKRKLANPEY